MSVGSCSPCLARQAMRPPRSPARAVRPSRLSGEVGSARPKARSLRSSSSRNERSDMPKHHRGKFYAYPAEISSDARQSSRLWLNQHLHAAVENLEESIQFYSVSTRL